MRIFLVSFFCLGLAASHGLKCGDVSGKWENELGSQMLLRVGPSNFLSGEYFTAVETAPGAAAFASNITGIYSKQGEVSLLAFSVLFNYGASVTSWIGQCTVCEGREVLHTSYIFRRHVTSLNEKWGSTMINYNTFFRHTNEFDNGLSNPSVTTYSPIQARSVVSNKDPGGLELSGKWKADDNGQEIEIFETNERILRAKYLSFNVTGNKDGNDMFTAVALMSTSGSKIRSWTGYIYHVPSTAPNVLETSWLEHSFNPNCEAARSDVRIGFQNFTQTIVVNENNLKKSETFMDKIRKFFSSMF